MSFLEKIFSYFSEKPAFKTEGGSLKATWDLEVEPYTKEEVVVKTNYLLPLIMLVLIVGGFALTVRYQGKGIIVTKTASRGKSSRGSAFKVTIRVKNRKDAIREVKIKDIFFGCYTTCFQGNIKCLAEACVYNSPKESV